MRVRLRNRKRLLHHRIEEAACGLDFLRLRPRVLHLSGDFRLAQHHGIQTGDDPEDVGQGNIVHQPVEVRPLAEFELIFLGQEPQDRVGGGRNVAGPQDEFRAIAGRQNDDFFDTFRANQLQQSIRNVVPG